MSWRDLSGAGGSNGSRAEKINRAIRREIAGGSIALDRVRDWHHICTRLGWGDRGAPPDRELLHVTAYRHMVEIVDAMDDEIRRRYGLPPRPDREDLIRSGDHRGA